MPKHYSIIPYDDQHDLYFADELIQLGCNPKQALQIQYSLHNHIRYVIRSSKKSSHYEIPLGYLINELSNDESIIPTTYGTRIGRYKKETTEP